MDVVNISVGVFSIPFTKAFAEGDDGEIVATFKSLNRYLSILKDNNRFRLKFVEPESGQLGKLTETGYRDGILGLIQKGEVDMSFFPVPLDTQQAPGYFTPVISEDNYYLLSVRSKGSTVGSVFSSLKSTSIIPILLVAFALLFMEIATAKRWNLTSLLTALYHSWSTLFCQHMSNRLPWYSLVQMIILMIPMFIFNASFNTQAIIRNNDAKIETLRDIITYDKIPIFIDGLSPYDFFKAQITRDYRDVYKQAVSKATDQLFELGPIPKDLKYPYTQLTAMISGTVLQIVMIVIPPDFDVDPDQIYISEKPFHSSLKGFLVGKNVSTLFKKRSDRIVMIGCETGIARKNEASIYADFAVNIPFYLISRFEMYKKEFRSKEIVIDWQPLKWDGFKHISYILCSALIVMTIILIIELIINFIVST